MAFGKQGKHAPAYVAPNKAGSKPGGKVVGGGGVKAPMPVKSVGKGSASVMTKAKKLSGK